MSSWKKTARIFSRSTPNGSVLDDGAAGAVFVVPEFNNITHSFPLLAVSIYTAELVAILMAYECDSYPAVSYSHL